MQCACLVDRDGYDGDWEESCKSKHIISKTPHKCVECEKPIPPGTRYLLEIVKWEEDNTGRYRTCPDCESLRDNLTCCWQYGSVLDDIRYAIEDLPEDGIPWATFAKLTPGAKDYVFSIIEGRWTCHDCGAIMLRPYDNGDGNSRCEDCAVNKYEELYTGGSKWNLRC